MKIKRYGPQQALVKDHITLFPITRVLSEKKINLYENN